MKNSEDVVVNGLLSSRTEGVYVRLAFQQQPQPPTNNKQTTNKQQPKNQTKTNHQRTTNNKNQQTKTNKQQQRDRKMRVFHMSAPCLSSDLEMSKRTSSERIG